MSDAALESLLRRDRYVVVAALLILAVLAWSYLLLLAEGLTETSPDMAMPGMAMGAVMAQVAAPRAMDLLAAFAMWTVMMVGMMTPSVAPVVLLYARVGRQAASEGKPFAATGWFAAGYFLAWTAFSALAVTAQMALRGAELLNPMMESANPVLGGAILMIAGIYQWSRLKNSCLMQCRDPLQFIQRHGGFKRTAAGSLMLGLRHGLYCIGCCWAIMLLLFVGGVMNVLWAAGLAVLVLLEKFPMQGSFLTRAMGAVLLAGGLMMIYRGLFAAG